MSARTKNPSRSGRSPAPSERARARAAIHAKKVAADSSVDPSELITKFGPERTCVGCGEKASPTDLVRIVLGPESTEPSGAREIAVDTGNGSFGRGAHLHPVASCVTAAAQRGLQRSFKAALLIDGEKLDAAQLTAAIASLANRRIEGLLGAAKRAHRMALGADAVVQSARAGEAHLILVATDAASAADLSEVRRAVVEGRAVAWGTKEELARAVGGADRSMGVGVVAVTDTRLARAIGDAARLVDAMSHVPLRGQETTRAVQASERRGGAILRPRTDVNGGSRLPEDDRTEKGLQPSDDGSQAVE